MDAPPRWRDAQQDYLRKQQRADPNDGRARPGGGGSGRATGGGGRGATEDSKKDKIIADLRAKLAAKDDETPKSDDVEEAGGSNAAKRFDETAESKAREREVNRHDANLKHHLAQLEEDPGNAQIEQDISRTRALLLSARAAWHASWPPERRELKAERQREDVRKKLAKMETTLEQHAKAIQELERQLAERKLAEADSKAEQAELQRKEKELEQEAEREAQLAKQQQQQPKDQAATPNPSPTPATRPDGGRTNGGGLTVDSVLGLLRGGNYVGDEALLHTISAALEAQAAAGQPASVVSTLEAAGAEDVQELSDDEMDADAEGEAEGTAAATYTEGQMAALSHEALVQVAMAAQSAAQSKPAKQAGKRAGAKASGLVRNDKDKTKKKDGKDNKDGKDGK